MAIGISTIVRVSNCELMLAMPPVWAYSTTAYTTNATTSPIAATSAQVLPAPSPEKSPKTPMPR